MPQAIAVSVDVALLTLREGRLQVVLYRRENPPFQGALALPGGYIHTDEDEDDGAAARRMLLAKTGIRTPYVEQLKTFADRSRDPRGWSVSISFYALVDSTVLEGSRSAVLEILPADALPRLAFDHDRIVAAALERVRNKSAYSTLPCYLLPETFTLSQMQSTYEQVLGVKLDKSAFRRKVLNSGFVEEIEGAMQGGVHRPAQLYRIPQAQRLVLRTRTL